MLWISFLCGNLQDRPGRWEPGLDESREQLGHRSPDVLEKHLYCLGLIEDSKLRCVVFTMLKEIIPKSRERLLPIGSLSPQQLGNIQHQGRGSVQESEHSFLEVRVLLEQKANIKTKKHRGFREEVFVGMPQHTRKIFMELAAVKFWQRRGIGRPNLSQMLESWHQPFSHDGHDGPFKRVTFRIENQGSVYQLKDLAGEHFDEFLRRADACEVNHRPISGFF